MLALRKAIPATKSLVGASGLQLRNSAISGPPRVKLSGAQKGIFGSVIFAGLVFYPTWVLANIKNYRGASEE